ncbi:flavodoxin family protein [Erysipelothrix sp. HDW6A]|uniref:NAD(P)H-dependent oxidoreductase n=1 Tax=Erysipelothrix sp. HDW6A TaxID=2714928 RepID=UPI00140DF585|nr:NAD(P)H-dependent oxidoreductase [Erysipelothrix sp. HDW6A]QIK58017.1 flavodoxin family protein [Erysipelothrix sp. HDW6A]
MKTTIVYAHPWDGSFNHSILEDTKAALIAKNHDVDVIDLHADNFDPVMRPADLRVFGRGEYHDELALDYKNRLQASDEVIFIFPIWWYGLPAILKGFFDKVMLKGHTYSEDEDHNLVGLLDVSKAAVFTTANINKEIFGYLGDPIQNALISGLFKTVGINNVTWIHCPTVHLEESRNNFKQEIKEYLAK